MTIPLRNIYYLLAYAWDRLDQAEVIGVDLDDFSGVADLLASVLTRGVRHLLKRGLNRGYRELDEVVPGVRGRLRFNESVRANLFSTGRAYCSYEELSADVVHNRIIAQTLRDLIGINDLAADVADGVRDCLGRLGSLTPIRLVPLTFSRVQLHGNNAFYAFLLDICRLVYDATAVDERTGVRRFPDFLREDGPMARLFERFVFNFLKREQRVFTVGNRVIKWAHTSGTLEDLARLPRMRTDVYLSSSKRRIVIDAKYYRAPLRSHFGKDTVRSTHLYQLYSYLRNLTLAEPELPIVEGILVYPMVDQPLDMKYDVHGHPVWVRTVDLGSNWRDLANSLLELTG